MKPFVQLHRIGVDVGLWRNPMIVDKLGRALCDLRQDLGARAQVIGLSNVRRAIHLTTVEGVAVAIGVRGVASWFAGETGSAGHTDIGAARRYAGRSARSAVE